MTDRTRVLPKPYYDDGTATIYHGDFRDVLPQLPPGTADLVVTDPPYAAAAATVTTGRGKATWGGNWGDMSLVSMMAEAVLDSPSLSEEHEVYWFADHLSYAALVPSFFRRYRTVQNIVWDKDRMGMGSYYRKQTELVLYGRTREAAAFPSRSSRDLIRVKPNYSGRVHPAQKPVALLAEFMANSDWSCVVDPFMGSGTTLVAASRLGRSCIGIDVEERWCEAAAKRLQGDQPRLIPDRSRQ